MELLYIENSRVIRLAVATRKQGQLYTPSVIAAIVDRYRFVSYPTTLEEMNRTSMDFYQGLYNDVAIAKMSIYADGVSVESKSNTDILDNFLDNLLSWADLELGVKTVQHHAYNRIYNSEIVIFSQKDIFSSFKRLKKAQDYLGRKMLEASGVDIHWESVGWTIGYDGTKTTLKPTMFRLERRAGSDHTLRHYFSAAPLKTNEHLELVGLIEEVA